MKYNNYKTDDFIKDEYFQKWVLSPDTMTEKFWGNWLITNPDKKEEVDKAIRMVRLLANNDEEKLSQVDFDTMWQHIIERRRKTEKYLLKKNKSVKTTWKAVLKIAAVFVGILAISYGVQQSGMLQTEDQFPVETPQITLKLQDGTVKILDESASGEITTVSGRKIGNQKQHLLVYNDVGKSDVETLGYNELTVPYGKRFELVLSDGSHILLNSGTTLRYPVQFIKGEPRNVFLDGEAFFTVTEDKDRPFTVVTDEMNTRVYGTKFNVTSYKNEHNTSTVLVEGSVRVYLSNNDTGKQSIAVVPGEQAVFKDGEIKVEKVDVRKYIAWTEGKLFFVNDRFELILKELERHFNVQINNQVTQLNTRRFTSTFTNESLERILSIFQEHTPFRYVREENTLTIKPYRPM